MKVQRDPDNKNKRVPIVMHQCGRENQGPNLDGNELERQRGERKIRAAI